MVFTSVTYSAFVFSNTTLNSSEKQNGQSRTAESSFAHRPRPHSRNTWRASWKRSRYSLPMQSVSLAMIRKESQDRNASSSPSCSYRAHADASEVPTVHKATKNVPDTPFQTTPWNHCRHSRYGCEAAALGRALRASASIHDLKSPCQIRQLQRRVFVSS